MKISIPYVNGFFMSFLAATLLGMIANSSAWAYELMDLGTDVEPKSISNSGLVVGSSNTDQYPGTAFSWSSADGFKPIGDGTSANAVNESGQIAGTTIDGAFVVDGNYREWSDYGAFGVNQLGEVAGYSVGRNPYQPRSLPYNPAIFNGNKWKVFDIAKLYPRGTRPGVYADRFILNGINAGGYAVGYKYRYGLAGTSAIMIDTNGLVNDAADVVYLSTPYGGSAADINDSNMIVGTTGSNSSTGEYSFAFLYDYDAATLINLGTLPVNDTDFGLTSYAYDINELNQVVGSSRLITANTSLNDPTKYHAFIWEPAADGSLDGGTMGDLNNDNGDIVGRALVYGIEHGFILTNGNISEPPPAPNNPPVAAASPYDTSGKAPLTVFFDASASVDYDGTIEAYSWNFADGKFSTKASPSHKFRAAGFYPVTLTVTDDQGAAASSSISITVTKGKRR